MRTVRDPPAPALDKRGVPSTSHIPDLYLHPTPYGTQSLHSPISYCFHVALASASLIELYKKHVTFDEHLTEQPHE